MRANATSWARSYFGRIGLAIPLLKVQLHGRRFGCVVRRECGLNEPLANSAPSRSPKGVLLAAEKCCKVALFRFHVYSAAAARGARSHKQGYTLAEARNDSRSHEQKAKRNSVRSPPDAHLSPLVRALDRKEVPRAPNDRWLSPRGLAPN